MGTVTDTLLGVAGKVLDRVLPDQAAKDAANLELLKLAQSGELAQLQADTDLAKGQIDVNQTEAANANPFVSGWRPFVGWVCGVGLLYALMARPLLMGFLGKDFPPLEMETLLTLLMGMLGLGGMRTYEKVMGVAK